jgi:hypothetical protein
MLESRPEGEGRRQKAESRKQKAESRKLKAESRKQKGEGRDGHGLGHGAPEWRSHEILEVRERGAPFVYAVMWGRIAPWREGPRWKRLMEREL